MVQWHEGALPQVLVTWIYNNIVWHMPEWQHSDKVVFPLGDYAIIGWSMELNIPPQRDHGCAHCMQPSRYHLWHMLCNLKGWL